MDLTSHRLLSIIERWDGPFWREPVTNVDRHLFPEALEETEAAFESGIRPLKGLLRRRCKHGKQADRVGAITNDQMFGINAIVFGLRHLFGPPHVHRESIGLGNGAGDSAFVI